MRDLNKYPDTLLARLLLRQLWLWYDRSGEPKDSFRRQFLKSLLHLWRLNPQITWHDYPIARLIEQARQRAKPSSLPIPSRTRLSDLSHDQLRQLMVLALAQLQGQPRDSPAFAEAARLSGQLLGDPKTFPQFSPKGLLKEACRRLSQKASVHPP